MDTQNEIKIVVVGDGGVGKTTFVKRLLGIPFDKRYIATLGAEVYSRDNYIFWDLAGQEKFGGLRNSYYLGANIGIIMVDATSKITSNSIKNWYIDLTTSVQNIKIGIIINKIDCSNISNEAVDYAKSFSEGGEIPLIEISCKENLDIDKIKNFLKNI